jgi:hypothetical protein
VIAIRAPLRSIAATVTAASRSIAEDTYVALKN